jgi:hypothetical protein
MRRLLLATVLTSALIAVPATATIQYRGAIAVPGDAADLSGFAPGPNGNRTSFGSDLIFDQRTRTFYGTGDRGPGGGSLSYAPRLQAFTVDIGSNGSIGNFAIEKTVVYRRPNGATFNGLNPTLLNGNSAILGNSLDPEGLVRLGNGQFLVADEYGPSIYRFSRDGRFLGAFTQPDNVLPKAGTTPNFTDGRNTITTGRQDNRGYEGLTVSPDGKTAWGILQDPLVNEGNNNDGRRSANLRIVQFDVATGQSTGQFIYQLEPLSSINARIPGTVNDFGATAQGRNIGVSSITWIGEGRFLVIERDNRGEGPDNLVAAGSFGALPTSGTKRVYMIDINGATDVAGVSLAGTNTLPDGVVPVSKTLFLDVHAAFTAAGETISEKLEGLAIGPRLAGGGFALLLATDNDFSVTQNSDGVQFDVCYGGTQVVQVALGAACPGSTGLVPSRLYSFQVTGDAAAAFDNRVFAVPEPSSWAMLIAGFGLIGAMQRRYRMVARKQSQPAASGS